jgi:hypothetical protein
VQRLSIHTDAAVLSGNQHFKGTWRNGPENPEHEFATTLWLETEGDAVSGRISLSEDAEDSYPLDHIHLIANDLTFTFTVDPP